MEQVWITIRAQQARQRMLKLLDSGNLAEALGKKSYLDGLVEKMKGFVQQYGGSMPIALYDCIIMQVPFNAAEQLPSITQGYQDALKNQISIGVGLTFAESTKACKLSSETGKIELFDPQSGEFLKAQSRRVLHPDVTLPANVFSPNSPDDGYYQPDSLEDEVIIAPDADKAIEIETAYIEKLVAQMNPPQQEAPPGMPQEEGAPPPEGEQGTMDLLRMMSQGEEEGEAAPEEGAPAPEGESTVPPEAEAEIQQEVDEAEQQAEQWNNDQLAQTLQGVSSKIPEIMAMADQNPDAFKQTMNMVNKLISAAKQRPKDAKKSEELIQAAKELTKAFERKRIQSGPGAGKNTHFPVGTRKRNYKKVLVDGKEVWR